VQYFGRNARSANGAENTLSGFVAPDEPSAVKKGLENQNSK
jgi:hypothetical protein